MAKSGKKHELSKKKAYTNKKTPEPTINIKFNDEHGRLTYSPRSQNFADAIFAACKFATQKYGTDLSAAGITLTNTNDHITAPEVRKLCEQITKDDLSAAGITLISTKEEKNPSTLSENITKALTQIRGAI